MSEIARPLAEWNEDEGPVLWWKFPVSEPPYVGSPLDLGFTVTSVLYDQHGYEVGKVNANVGGWPGYHTHWTLLPKIPRLRKGARVRLITDNHDIPAGSLGTIDNNYGLGGDFATVAFDLHNQPDAKSHTTVSVKAQWLELAPPADEDDIVF